MEADFAEFSFSARNFFAAVPGRVKGK